MTTATDKLATSAATAIDTTTNGVASAASAVANSSTAKSLDNALATMINASVQGAGDAIAWAKYQIPDVIHQLLVWKAVESALWCALSFAVITLCVKLILNLKKKIAEIQTRNKGVRYCDKEVVDGYVLLAILPLAAGIASIAVFANSFDWLEIWIAPKIYLLEYAAQLLKGTH